ncbi:MAG TPA: hypothetical protein VK843_06280 [Planctomycetota bacterium]|nr:hypothetical protein [Planctomycetota bacterium]
MRRLLPAFVQRRLLLSAARRALSAGRPGAALEILRDELLASDPRAESLRTLVIPLVPSPPAPPKLEPARAAANPSGREDMRELLKQMRAARGLDGGPPAGPRVELGANSASAVLRAAPRVPPARLRMALDDAGSFLVCAGDQAVVGHSRAGEADVPILADLLPRHARFVLETGSFHAGSGWRVEPIGAARVQVGSILVGPSGAELAPGLSVRLGDHLSLGFEQPDSASLSCTLELEAGVEAAGAQRVLLFAPGPAGRMRIGARGSRHVQAALGGVELELVHDGVRLRILCASGMIPDEEQGSPPRTEFELPLRLERPLHLRLCMPTTSERPRWISFSPLEDA